MSPARSSRCTPSRASWRSCSRSRSCRATTRLPWRSCPTTAGTTSACSATTTRCPTSTISRSSSTTRGRSWWTRPRRPLRTASGLVAQSELRVLGHLLRRPRGREDHVRDDLGDAGDVADELHHLLGHLRTDRAGGRRERERDGHPAVFDLDPIDQSELNEIQTQLGIDDVAQRLEDVFFVDHLPP